MIDNIVLLIPSLNPDKKLIRTVEGMIAAGFTKILVVNDGSNSFHRWPFEEIAGFGEVTCIGYEENKGKGHALKYGFKYILENYDNVAGVLTADGDGQHMPADCINVANEMLAKNECVFGCRDFSDPSVPRRNKMGNIISIFAYNFLCEIKMSDTQTGLRAIPVRYLKEFIDVEGERFEYETNTLIYMKNHDMPFNEVKIDTVYESDSNEGSHFRVVEDSIRIYKPLIKAGGPRFLLFTLGSLLATLIDLAIFTVLTHLIARTSEEFLAIIASVFIATYTARFFSALFDYYFSLKFVFNKNKNLKKGGLLRYFVLMLAQAGVSAALVAVICFIFGITGVVRTAIKIVIDTCLFFVGYRIQREWVFK